MGVGARADVAARSGGLIRLGYDKSAIGQSRQFDPVYAGSGLALIADIDARTEFVAMGQKATFEIELLSSLASGLMSGC
ncbi:hypothetical protein XI06_34390 [Bradyrhizobium sp. CCBAU 11434]|nr:hypothetical protein [Bradyrhizobium sp. CCBAU 11434]